MERFEVTISVSIPVCTLSPICSSDIETAFPVASFTVDSPGKQLGGGGGRWRAVTTFKSLAIIISTCTFALSLWHIHLIVHHQLHSHSNNDLSNHLCYQHRHSVACILQRLLFQIHVPEMTLIRYFQRTQKKLNIKLIEFLL